MRNSAGPRNLLGLSRLKLGHVLPGKCAKLLYLRQVAQMAKLFGDGMRAGGAGQGEAIIGRKHRRYDVD